MTLYDCTALVPPGAELVEYRPSEDGERAYLAYRYPGCGRRITYLVVASAMMPEAGRRIRGIS